MTGADAFLDAIFAAPADDTPRLVYADWLEEQGHGEYAEFIRLCCRLAAHDVDWSVRADLRRQRFETIRRLFREWQDSEGEELPVDPKRGGYERGIYEGQVFTTPVQFLASADRWLPLVPVRWLCLYQFDSLEQAVRWAGQPLLRGVRGLSFCGAYPHPWDAPIDPERVLAALRSPYLDGLQSLHIRPVTVTHRFIRELADCPAVRRLGPDGGLLLTAWNLDDGQGHLVEVENGYRRSTPAEALADFLSEYGDRIPIE